MPHPPAADSRGDLPPVDIIVPVFNEAATVAAKIDNLAALTYPPRLLTLVIIDGGSTDDTLGIARRMASTAPFSVEVIGIASSGKPQQLSAAFAACRADWVMVTDADARLEPGTLAAMVAATRADPRVTLVGTPVRPARAHRVDELHWRCANWLRRLESRLGSAGIVVGPAYLARRDLLAPFPRGTIMDDIHVSCRAAMANGRVAITAGAVTELRAPRTAVGLLRHKHRKALGCLREMLHFLPKVGRMSGPAKAAFLFRLLIIVALPILALAAGAAVYLSGVAASHVAGGLAVLVVAVLLSGSSRPAISSLPAASLLPLLWASTLTWAWVCYPFARQSARYPKVPLSTDDPA